MNAPAISAQALYVQTRLDVAVSEKGRPRAGARRQRVIDCRERVDSRENVQ